MAEENWEKRLEIARLKMQLKELTGQEILESMADPLDMQAAPSNDKTIQLTNGLQVSERTMKILKDPKPYQRPPEAPKPYKTTAQHYIVCVDAEKANESEPRALKEYGQAHKIGGFLVTDKLETPEGWIKAPERGSPISVIEKTYPVLFDILKAKGVTNF